ncbi:hypothetical protein RZO50_02645 [Microbacterium sp. SSW1-59]|uniref:hypothetical protein n=1 Tax=Microbacterium xanthum TaxID=3079794 RepID=UPI002AD37C01|nr:hypothetical protein [Microbacterium sp. SSW1-59]MDZ8200396.1 hypothetical protein [Microbacterium sp. SSW1-59]
MPPSRRRRRRQRHSRRRIVGVQVGTTVALAGLFGVWGLVVGADVSSEEAVVCTSPGVIGETAVAGYSGDQLAHALTIMSAGADAGFGRDGQRLGVMAAMGESGLRNIDYGDWETSGVTNPDGSRTSSIGLFQQQDWWGSVEERMDPDRAAALFFARLATIERWQEMPASRAIHAVQINADPEHYARWADAATAVTDALSTHCLD